MWKYIKEMGERKKVKTEKQALVRVEKSQ